MNGLFNKIKIIVLLGFVFNQPSFANCPTPDNVTYYHFDPDHGSWRADWYEGFPEAGIEDGEHPAGFNEVFWGTKINHKPKPTEQGSTVCFYHSRQGKMIRLTQNKWGEVDYPAGSNWKEGFFDDHIGRKCYESASLCNFHYPA